MGNEVTKSFKFELGKTTVGQFISYLTLPSFLYCENAIIKGILVEVEDGIAYVNITLDKSEQLEEQLKEALKDFKEF